MTPEQIREQWNQVGLEHLPVEYVVYVVAGILVEIAAQLAETNRFLHDNKLYIVNDEHKRRIDGQPTPADRGTARALIAHMEQPATLTPRGVVCLMELAAVDSLDDEPEPGVQTLNLPSFQRYEADHNLMTAQIAGEVGA
jgi:hypothetical protein